MQGDAAPGLIVRALRHLDRRPEVDVIVVARGGGSLEDLMAFNSETVCRAVATSATPVVSAVGHERDVTVCDLVADVRVSTPTAVAAVVVPSLEAVEARLDDASLAIRRGLERAGAAAGRSVERRADALVRALRGSGALGRDRVDRLAPRLTGALRRVGAVAPGELAVRHAGAATGRRRPRAGLGGPGGAGCRPSVPAVARAHRRARLRHRAGCRLDGAVIASAEGVGPGRALVIGMRDGCIAARAEEPAP